MGCVVCDGPVNILSHRCGDGSICGNCYSKTPSFFQVKNQDIGITRHICRVYDNENELMCKNFQETCRIGDLHFDGDNLLVVIGKIQKDGRIEEGNSDVFSIENVKDVSFSMNNVRKINDKKVLCDIVFTCSFHDTFWKINEVVSKGEVCSLKDDTYCLPVGVQIVWDEIVKKVNAKRSHLENAINNELPTQKDLQIFKAKVLFMLENNYTKEEVMSNYFALSEAFKTDKNKLDIIDKYKEILLDFISEF